MGMIKHVVLPCAYNFPMESVIRPSDTTPALHQAAQILQSALRSDLRAVYDRFLPFKFRVCESWEFRLSPLRSGPSLG
jgi:hypothetical protein